MISDETMQKSAKKENRTPGLDVRIYRILIFRLPPDLAPFEHKDPQVAGFHRAVPSTALDKACMQFVGYSTEKSKNVNT